MLALLPPLVAAGALLRPSSRPSWQRLRGGAAESNGGSILKLSRQEIGDKLNRVPAFCVMQADGSVISLPDPDGAEGAECCTWFLDAAEAQFTLRQCVKANADLEGLHLQMFGLGDVFAMCGGWPGDASASSSESALKLQGNRAVLKQCESQLIDGLRRQGLEPGMWRLPVFIGEELAQAEEQGGEAVQTRLPIFFTPEDIQAAYEQAGVPKAAVAGVKVMDLRQLVESMQTEPPEYPNPWRAVQFVCAPSAMELAQELARKRQQPS
eukprot:Transcript_16071.p2 GENE.Transcript_16071~~Transcript_16071.p2  ORF type:complete len:267 (-),score=112.77 Transcript_16071:116-916(-)